MATQEIHLEEIIGRKVLAINGRHVGRLEEVVGDLEKGQCYITEFRVGRYAVLDRLSAWKIGRAFLSMFGMRIKKTYRIPWNRIDFADPRKPKLTCQVSELPH